MAELTTFGEMISKNQFKFVRQLEQKKYRRREGLFVAEGTKVVGDLMQHSQPRMLFATSEYLRNSPFLSDHSGTPLLSNEGSEVVEVSPDELRRLSFLQHPQQVLALFPLPSPSHSLTPSSSHLSLALDGVQDPGNLGTIIRIADWFGIDTIYCSPDTADAYSPKVVQATMGSLAHVHIIYCNLVDLLSKAGCPVYGTLLDGENIYNQDLTQNGIIVMGNEGNGISEAVRPLITNRLLIPNFHENAETAESLNVAIATAITCSEFKRRF